jgi:hypothetical protein
MYDYLLILGRQIIPTIHFHTYCTHLLHFNNAAVIFCISRGTEMQMVAGALALLNCDGLYIIASWVNLDRLVQQAIGI